MVLLQTYYKFSASLLQANYKFFISFCLNVSCGGFENFIFTENFQIDNVSDRYVCVCIVFFATIGNKFSSTIKQ